MPWQLLIQARYRYQIDAHIASTVISTVGRLAPQGVAAKLSDAAAGAVRRGVSDRKEVGDERRITFLDAVASWEEGDIGPPWWRFPFPVPPRPRWADEVGDPVMCDAGAAPSTLSTPQAARSCRRASAMFYRSWPADSVAAAVLCGDTQHPVRGAARGTAVVKMPLYGTLG